MRRWIAAALMCLCLALAIAPRTVLADSGGWTYDPGAQTLTNGSVTLKNVTADGDGGITIGRQDDVAMGDLDLTGPVTGADNKTYVIVAIGDSAFQSCYSLWSVTLGDGVEIGRAHV